MGGKYEASAGVGGVVLGRLKAGYTYDKTWRGRERKRERERGRERASRSVPR